MLVTTVSPAKIAEPIKMPFWEGKTYVGTRNNVLHGRHSVSMTEQSKIAAVHDVCTITVELVNHSYLVGQHGI